MKKIYFTLFFVLILCGFSHAQTSTIEPELQDILNQKNEELIDIQIYFKSSVDSKELNRVTRRVSDKTTKRNIVVEELMNHSKEVQSNVMTILKAEELNGNVANINCLWISNSISCKASREVIYQLSSRSDIKLLGSDKEIQMISPEQMKEVETSQSAMRGPAHHLVTINADDVQNQGYTGKNIVVAVLDSGTNTEHLDLKDHLWEGYVDTDGDGEVDELVNGWNYIANNSNITDDYGHGTHCAGIVCGDGTSGTTAGVAPDASLMTLKVVGQAGGGTLTGMMAAVQFAIKNGADVMSLSFGFKHSQLTTAQKLAIRETFDNALATGVVACAAVGNDGTNIGFPWNVDYPAACPAPWSNPDQTLKGGLSGVIAVGADDLIGQSSQGPSTWEDTKVGDYAYNSGASMGLIRPDICAPGALITSSHHLVNNDQRLMSGTSQSTPCVAGVIALMLEKNGALTPAQISQIIEETAANKPTSKNNVVGAGRIDALAAVNAVTQGTGTPFIQFVSFTPEITTPGQNVNLSLTFQNQGKASSATASTVTVTSNSPYVTISETTKTLGQISVGNNKTLNFEISVNSSVPNGHVATFDVKMTSGNYTWKDNFSVKVSATPNIVFQSVTPGVINVDQDVNINVTMINNGSADLNGTTTLTLSTLNSDLKYVTIVDNEATIGALAAGETGTGTFTIRANNTVPHNYGFDFFLEIFSESNTVTDYAYEFESDMNEWTALDGANNTIAGSNSTIKNPWWHSSDAGQHGKPSVASYSGNGHLMSSSNEAPYYYTKPLDNYLISPKKIKVTANSEFSFYARPSYDHAERFGVAISTSDNTSANNFTTISQWVTQGTTWTKYTVDLSSYAGQEIYVAIRHFFTQDEWDNSENGADYDALCIDDIMLSNVAINITHTPTYSYDDPNYFQIFAYNMIELPKVEGLTATVNGTSEISLSWNAVDKAKGYNIYCNGQKIVSNTTATSYTHQNLSHNTQYCYEVAAVYSGTEFEHSDEACATTQQLARNIVVKDYSPKTIYVGSNDGSISYTLLNDGANQLDSKSYVNVTCNSDYVTFSGTDSFAQISALNPNEDVTKTVSITVDTSIPNNSILTFNLNVSNTSIGTLNPNEYFTFDLPIQITVKNDPGTPKNLKVKSYTDNSITLGWDAIANAISYNIYRDGEYVGNTSATSYFDSGLNFSTQYCYTVTSINNDGESDHSEQVCQTTKEENLGISLKSYELEAGIGKDIELVATLINKGSETTPAGTAHLVCDDQYVNIVSGSANFGAIAANGETTVTFIVNLSATIPTNYVLNFNVIAEYDGESFGSTSYKFDTSEEFDIWTKANQNGNTYNWEYNSNGYAISYSYKNGDRDVCNLLISPNKIKISDNTSISFKVASTYTGNNNYYAEKYEVSITEMGASPTYGWNWIEDEIKVMTETLSSEAKDTNWQNREISLSSYAGKVVYIVFRHVSKGNEAIVLDDIEFKNFSLVGTISSSSTISVTVNPSLNAFAGEGLWSDVSKWSKGAVPTATDDVIINGNATIESGDITVKSLSINNNTTASLTVNSGVSLTVSEAMVNNNADAFIINDGAQIFQNSDNVAATFRMLIDNPTSWGYDHNGGWQFIASPVTGASIYDFDPETTDYDLFKYDGTQELQWINVKNHATDFESKFMQGRGYIVSYEAQTKADFKGILNNDKTFTFTDVKSFDTENHYNNFYLLGNPFSFDMNWNELTTVTDVYNGYATISNIDGSYDYHTSGTIKVGDGFMVKTTGDSPIFTYGNSRARNEKTESINVIASNIYGSDNVVVNLAGQEEEGFLKLDNLNKEITEIYVGNDGKRYGIFSFDEDANEVKLSFNAKHTGSHIISIEPDGEFEYITLVDNFTGEEINMLNGRYEFMVYSTEESRDRFSLKFCKKVSVENENFVYQSGNELIIEAEGTVQIIDIMGRIVYTNEVSGSSRINVSNLNKAAYIIRRIENTEVSTQKIVIM